VQITLQHHPPPPPRPSAGPNDGGMGEWLASQVASGLFKAASLLVDFHNYYNWSGDLNWAQLAQMICSQTRASSPWSQYTSATPSLYVLVGEWSDCTNLGAAGYTNLADPTVVAGLRVLYANQMSLYSSRGGTSPGPVGQHHWALRMGSGWDPRPSPGAPNGGQVPGTAWNSSFTNFSNAVWNLGELIRVGVAQPLAALNVTGVCRCNGCSPSGAPPVLAAPPAFSLPASSATWQGRTITGASGEVTWDWEGVAARIVVGPGVSDLAMVAAFVGSGAKGSPGFRILVDDENSPPAANISLSVGGPRSVPLLTGLDASVAHNVTVFYQTDPITLAWPELPAANVTVYAFTSSAGPISPAPRRNRSLLFIGDSITAGNQIDPNTCADDNWGTYGAKLCRAFDADCTTAAISGAGIYENCCPIMNGTTMATIWDRVLAYDGATASAPFPSPDAVTIALGTNDANTYNGRVWACCAHVL
jgi:hypothetical protein